ncbi:hypothetical protein [Roseisalinus antarcticus]|uniref:Uncharacterized protein n=1 Tax=Roseisalinus antarcticus TaxID=254357 RepID=A0A1Y5TNE2_9RHOB|nr:hypothetical protein [Roseisalinus antarcticus]SLN67721.1 hypothetical protein ROA7023_03257 [Roseisalinus antarcticus]
MVRSLAALAALILPAALNAEPVLVDDPAACALYDANAPGAMMTLQGEDRTVLTPDGMSAIEWYCEFETPVELDWADDALAIRPGYCMEPGPGVFPDVFVIADFQGEDGIVYLWSMSGGGTGEATVFYRCD